MHRSELFHIKYKWARITSHLITLLIFVGCEQLKFLVKLDYTKQVCFYCFYFKLLKKIKTEETHFVDFVSYFLGTEKS